MHASLLHLSRQPHHYAVQIPCCNRTPQASEDRLDCSRCLASAPHWLPSNEVLRAQLGIVKPLVHPWAWMGKYACFLCSFEFTSFPCDKLSKILLNYSVMCWDLSALHCVRLCLGRWCHPTRLLGLCSSEGLTRLEIGPWFKSTLRCTQQNASPCRAAEGAWSQAAGAQENPVHMSRALICRWEPL